MNPIVTQQATLDNALVPSEKILKIERCNARIAFTKPQKEEIYQVTLEALKISPCYPAFQITAEVPEIYMHQFWKTFKKIGKLDACDVKLDKKKCRVDTKAMYNQMDVDYVSILWEDFMYQVDNRKISSSRKVHPRFTKVIIDHFISKENTISMRNRINLHTSHDDTLLGTLKFVSKTEDYHIYGATIPDGMINDDIKLSKAYKTYLGYETRKVPLNKARKFKTIPASPKEPTHKAPAKTSRGKVIELISHAALLKEAQMKKALKKHKRQLTTFWLAALVRELILNQSEDESDDDHDEDDNDNEDDDDDDDGNDDDSGNDDDGHNDAQDSEQTDSDNEENPSFTLKEYEEEVQDEEYVFSPNKDKSDDEEKMFEEEDDDVAKELYEDLNIIQGLRDTDLTNAQQGGKDQLNASHESGFVQEKEDAHVKLITIHDKTEGLLQSSFILSDFTSKLLNLDDPSLDINSLKNTLTIPLYLLPVSALETKVFEFNQTSQFTKVVSLISSIVDNYLASKLKEEVNVAVRLQSNKLKEEAKAENQEFINQVDSTIKQIIKEKVNQSTRDILHSGSFIVRIQSKEDSFDKMKTNILINYLGIQNNLYNALIEAYNSDKDIFTSYGDFVTLKRGRDDQDKNEDHSAGSDRGRKRRKSSKDVEPLKGSKSKESKSSSSSKGTQLQHKSFGKSTQAEEPEFKVTDTEMQYDQGNESSHISNQLDNEASPKHDCKPLLLIEDQGRQVVHATYFINNDLEYLKGGSSSSKYVASTKRTKAAKYDNIEGKEDMVPRLWSPVKFKEGDFPRLNLCDIKDMLLLLVQKKLSNLDLDDRYDLGVALRIFTKRIVILHRVEDLQ
nr:hypothetical protein [Tanacetum cinerariifolium]